MGSQCSITEMLSTPFLGRILAVCLFGSSEMQPHEMLTRQKTAEWGRFLPTGRDAAAATPPLLVYSQSSDSV